LFVTYPFIAAFAAVVPKGFFPVFNIEPVTVVFSASAAIIVGLLAAMFPIQRALSTKIVDGLRHIG
jgi:putative ABC transport system permease protein